MGALCSHEAETGVKGQTNKDKPKSNLKTKDGKMATEILSSYSAAPEIKFILGYWRIR